MSLSLNTQPQSILHADLTTIKTSDAIDNTKNGPTDCEKVEESVIRPQRKLSDTAEDRILSGLCQKTKAISIEERTTGLGPNESGWINALYSQEYNQIYWAVRLIRRYVCGENSEIHAQNLLSWHIFTRLNEFLDEKWPEELIFETLWIVTNIAAGPTAHTTAIVENQVLVSLSRLLYHASGSIRTQTTWAIGNIVGDREGYRDKVLEHCSLNAILHIWEGEFKDESSRKEAFRICLWVVDNMMRYRPDFQLMEPAFDMIPVFLKYDDPLLLKEVCWATSRILHAAGRNAIVDKMIALDFCSRIVELLSRNNMMITHPLLRAVLNLSGSKNPIHIQYICEAGILEQLDILLNSLSIPANYRHSFEMTATQILGNFAIYQPITLLILSTPLIYRLCQMIEPQFQIVNGVQVPVNAGLDTDLQKEAVLFFKNALSHKDDYISKKLLDFQIVPFLYSYIQRSNGAERGQLYAVDALIHLFVKADSEYTPTNKNVILEVSEQHKGFEILLDLYLTVTGINLDDLHQMVDNENEIEDQSSEDEKPAVNIDTRQVQNLKKLSKKRNLLSMKERLASKTKYIMKTWFMEKFTKTLSDSRSSMELWNSLQSMHVADATGPKNSMLELINEFNSLLANDKVNLNSRTDSEITLNGTSTS